MQEAAQYLAGDSLPSILLSSIIAKSGASDASLMGVMNLTPYDGWVERVCKNGVDGVSFKSLSLSKSLQVTQYVEKTLAMELLEAGLPLTLCLNDQ